MDEARCPTLKRGRVLRPGAVRLLPNWAELARWRGSHRRSHHVHRLDDHALTSCRAPTRIPHGIRRVCDSVRVGTGERLSVGTHLLLPPDRHYGCEVPARVGDELLECVGGGVRSGSFPHAVRGA